MCEVDMMVDLVCLPGMPCRQDRSPTHLRRLALLHSQDHRYEEENDFQVFGYIDDLFSW